MNVIHHYVDRTIMAPSIQIVFTSDWDFHTISVSVWSVFDGSSTFSPIT